MKYLDASEMLRPNGKTIWDSNHEKEYTISVGSLVEVNETGLRLYVGLQIRGNDGAPMYCLTWIDPKQSKELHLYTGCFSDECLTVIRMGDDQ